MFPPTWCVYIFGCLFCCYVWVWYCCGLKQACIVTSWLIVCWWFICTAILVLCFCQYKKPHWQRKFWTLFSTRPSAQMIHHHKTSFSSSQPSPVRRVSEGCSVRGAKCATLFTLLCVIEQVKQCTLWPGWHWNTL